MEFEGDTSALNQQQQDLIASVLKKEGFGDAKVTISSIGGAGDNYVANVKRIIAEKDGESFRMVVKIAPTIEQLRTSSNTHIMFHNEYVMYSKVLPKLAEMEKSAQIPESERVRYAKFYGAIMEEPSEIILLEDLQVSGFVILNRFKPLPHEAIKLVIKTFAQFHSRSFALKYKEPDTFEAFKKALYNVYILMNNENIAMYFTSLEEDAKAMLTSDKHKNAVKNTASKFSEIVTKLNKIDYSSRYSVIQQGDSWTNNIMFKLEGEAPKECCMIDYQISRVNSPVADLHYMIFNCSDYETRLKHYNEWIDYYHSELNKNLFEFGLKADYCYPRDQLDADLKRHGKSSLVQAIMLATVLTRNNDEAAKMKELMEQANDSNLEEMLDSVRMTAASSDHAKNFATKIEEVIDSLMELGYI